MMKLVLVLVLSLEFVGSFPRSTPGPSSDPSVVVSPCQSCEPAVCPPAVGCRAGLVSGFCGCCEECGNILGQACDLGPTPVQHGLCGPGMRCAPDPRPGSPDEEDEEELVCVCKEQEAVCGTDGNTYLNRCEFREAAFSRPQLKVKGKGPCKTAPVIKVPPLSQVNSSGILLSFLCEVHAFPPASVEWRRDGHEGALPGDDPHLSVQSRGGPLQYEISSWLQISGADEGDSGSYQCVARNKLGSVSASAQLRILSPEELSSHVAHSVSEMNRLLDYDQDLY